MPKRLKQDYAKSFDGMESINPEFDAINIRSICTRPDTVLFPLTRLQRKRGFSSKFCEVCHSCQLSQTWPLLKGNPSTLVLWRFPWDVTAIEERFPPLGEQHHWFWGAPLVVGSHTSHEELHHSWGATPVLGNYTILGELHQSWGATPVLGSYTILGEPHRSWGAPAVSNGHRVVVQWEGFKDHPTAGRPSNPNIASTIQSSHSFGPN